MTSKLYINISTFHFFQTQLQIVICAAMNFARMQEARYYEASSEVGEEGLALQQ